MVRALPVAGLAASLLLIGCRDTPWCEDSRPMPICPDKPNGQRQQPYCYDPGFVCARGEVRVRNQNAHYALCELDPATMQHRPEECPDGSEPKCYPMPRCH